MRRTVNPPGVFDSLQYGFSQAVVTAGGHTIYVSGQVGWDGNEELVADDLEAQIEAAIGNLAAVLDAAGAGLEDVASLRVYIVEAVAADLSPVRRALRAAFPTDPPAATWLVVRALADPGMLVEVEACAVVPCEAGSIWDRPARSGIISAGSVQEDAVERLRFGVMSTADIGMSKVTPAIAAAENCDVVAIASRDTDRAHEAARRLDIPRAFDTYAGLLSDPDVDAVYIPLPNHLHAEWTIEAAQAGKHVLCEKPLAMNAAEAQEMVDACREAGVVLMEAFMYRLHPSWTHAVDLVRKDVIGDLVAVQSWFSYFNDDPGNIRNVAEYGGGALMDIGCYNVNLSRMLFGREPASIDAVMRRDPHAGVDVLTSAVLGFGDGHATFTCSTRAEPDQRVHIVGTRGRIDIEIPFNIPPDLPTRVSLTAGGDPPVAPATEVLTFDPKNAYTAQAEAFAAAVLDGTPVPVSNADSVANMAVIDAIVATAG